MVTLEIDPLVESALILRAAESGQSVEELANAYLSRVLVDET